MFFAKKDHAIAPLATLRDLRFISLEHHHALSDRAVCALISSCVNLRCARLDGCTKVSIIARIRFEFHCKLFCWFRLPVEVFYEQLVVVHRLLLLLSTRFEIRSARQHLCNRHQSKKAIEEQAIEVRLVIGKNLFSSLCIYYFLQEIIILIK